MVYDGSGFGIWGLIDFQENNHREIRKFLLGMNNLLLIARLVSTAGDHMSCDVYQCPGYVAASEGGCGLFGGSLQSLWFGVEDCDFGVAGTGSMLR